MSCSSRSAPRVLPLFRKKWLKTDSGQNSFFLMVAYVLGLMPIHRNGTKAYLGRNQEQSWSPTFLAEHVQGAWPQHQGRWQVALEGKAAGHRITHRNQACFEAHTLFCPFEIAWVLVTMLTAVILAYVHCNHDVSARSCSWLVRCYDPYRVSENCKTGTHLPTFCGLRQRAWVVRHTSPPIPDHEAKHERLLRSPRMDLL